MSIAALETLAFVRPPLVERNLEQRLPLAPGLRAFLLIGVLGGFTTFSSYAFESFSLLRDGQFLAASVNIVGQVVAGLAGLWAGYVITN